MFKESKSEEDGPILEIVGRDGKVVDADKEPLLAKICESHQKYWNRCRAKQREQINQMHELISQASANEDWEKIAELHRYT